MIVPRQGCWVNNVHRHPVCVVNSLLLSPRYSRVPIMQLLKWKCRGLTSAMEQSHEKGAGIDWMDLWVPSFEHQRGSFSSWKVRVALPQVYTVCCCCLGSSRVDSSKHQFCYEIVATSSGAMSDDKDVSAHSANSVSMTLAAAAAAAAEATAQP